MKAPNIPAGYVVNNFLRKKILQNVYGQYMKESNILADHMVNNFLMGEVFLNTTGEYMYGVLKKKCYIKFSFFFKNVPSRN